MGYSGNFNETLEDLLYVLCFFKASAKVKGLTTTSFYFSGDDADSLAPGVSRISGESIC